MFSINLGANVQIAVSGEEGTVIGRAEYPCDENRYLVRYKAGDGRGVESWWPESALINMGYE